MLSSNSRRAALALVLLLACGAPVLAGNRITPPPKVELAWNRFYDNEELLAAFKVLEKAHPEWLRIRSIGKSSQGRDLWMAIVGDPEVPEGARPAMYIDGNIHGNEIQGAEVCLYTVWYLLEKRDSLEAIRELLARVDFYVLPTVNPDGRHAWFHGIGTAHTPRSGLSPLDEDRDGRVDEDGPDDLDGDGEITSMRRRVESGGTHRPHPEEPRRLIRAEPGDDAPYQVLGWEGIDNDGDGELNEDGPGGYDMNRNFPGDWGPGWLQHGAGAYPLCFPETRAIAEFIGGHPNIAAAQSYHNVGGMVLRGPGSRGPDYPGEDRRVFDSLGETGKRMLPHYVYKALGRDLYPARGTFLCWAFEQRGIFAFTNELWARGQYSGQDAGDDHDAARVERMKWDDEMEHGRHFRPWRPYLHPLYGEIEIGGMSRAIGRVPPVFMLEELCHRNMAFTLHHAREMPELELWAPEVTALDGGLFRVRAEVRNKRLTPTRAAYARLRGVGLPDFFSISVPGGRVLAGGLLGGPPMRERVEGQQHRPARLVIESGVPSHGAVRAEWIVAHPGGSLKIELEYKSEKGGRVLYPAGGNR